jgi:site-specific DNA-methyltransferase (adenine-specific)
LEWLERRRSKSVHAVVTDPPYAIVEYLPEELKKRANGKGIWRLPQSYDGYQRTMMPRFTVLRRRDLRRIARFHSKLGAALFRVLVPGGHVIMASHSLFTHLVIDAFLGAGFELRGQVARVVKTLRGGDRPKGAHKRFPEVSVTPRSCWEPWLIFRRPCEGLVRDNLRKWHTGALRRPSKGTPFSDLIVAGPARGAERKIAPHPSVKPQVLMRQLVAAALPLRTGVVLDPFMGSGSTLAAAEALGFRSIGIELNTAYFNLARRAIPRLASLEVILPAAPASGARRSSTRAPSSHNGSAGGGQRPAARGREPT